MPGHTHPAYEDAATDTLLSVDQVAVRLGLSTITVRRILRRGELPAVRIGGSVRIRPSDLERLIAQASTDVRDHQEQRGQTEEPAA